MQSNEQELDNLVQEFKTVRSNVPPLFEIYVTLFSILASIMLFSIPNMLGDYMLYVMSQIGWAFSLFIACMLNSTGLIFRIDWLRQVGLGFSFILYSISTVVFIIVFPNMWVIVFSCMSVFSIISIPFVQYTGIRK